MRWGLKSLAGSPAGVYGHADGSGDQALFDSPLDIVATSDETIIYIADYGNEVIRSYDVATGQVGTFMYLYGVPHDTEPDTWIGGRPRHLALNSDGSRLLVTADPINDDAPGGVIFEIDVTAQTAVAFTPGKGTLGAVAYSPDNDGTAIIKGPLDDDPSGWLSLSLEPPTRGELVTLPNPATNWCDLEETIPITKVSFNDGAFAGDAGVGYIGSVVVGYAAAPQAVIAFDPLQLHPFPGPYATCDPPVDPAGVAVPYDTTLNPPWQVQVESSGDGTGGIAAAAFNSDGGIIQVVNVDLNNVESPFSPVIYGPPDPFGQPLVTNQPVVGCAFLPVANRWIFSTAGSFATPMVAGNLNDTGYNQIVELALVPDPPANTGGSGQLPIGTERPEEPASLIDDDGDLLIDDDGNTLIFG